MSVAIFEVLAMKKLGRLVGTGNALCSNTLVRALYRKREGIDSRAERTLPNPTFSVSIKHFSMAAAIERMANFIRPAGIAAALAIVLTSPLQVAAEDAQMPPIAEPSAAAAGPEVAAGDAFKAGDIAATGFAGSKLTAESLPPGVDPVTKSFIDPDGTVLRVYSLGNLGPSASGQTLNPVVVFQAKARDIGHVFGLAFDNQPADQSAKPGLFAAATSAFGLQIVGADKSGAGLTRLWKGGPGAAFMAGQFGSMPGAGPGTIYKIDRATGDVHVFANVTTNGVVNSGPGIGGVAFDPTSRTLYASDLDTGLIHAFGSDGTDIAQFDHGVDGRPLGKKGAVGDNGKRADITSSEFAASNPTTWGFTQTERRIDALAIHGGRLYYAAADGPEIWSIGIDASGKFGRDPRFELAVAAAKAFPVTAIVFDQAGRMIIAQRGALESPSDYSQFTSKGPAQTLRFAPENPDDPNTPEHWKPVPDEYAVGNIEDFRATSGGLALQYAYKDDGSIDPATCGGTIIVSGDTLGAARNTTGLQLGKIDLVRPANTPPIQTGVIELDPDQNDPAARGHAGGIAVLQDCAGAGGFPPVAGGAPGGDFPAVAGNNEGGGFPPVPGGDAGAGGFPPVADTQEGGGGKTDDGTQEGGGGKTTNGALTMTKSPGSTTCSENQSCSYKITITNGSGQPVPGPVVISDVLSVGGAPFQKAKLDPPPAPWTCVGSAAPGMQCTHPGPVEPNVPLDLTLGFTPEPGSLVGATELKNCVSFPGAPAAQGNVPQQVLPPPPAPTSTSNGGLKVETLGTSPSCSPAAGNCEFEIKITNNTGQPIKDQPLKIFDTLAVGTQSQAKNEAKTIQTPEGLQCKPQGREFNCSQELKSLAPNESVTLKVAFSVDTTEGGQANFVQNKTNVTFGPLTGEATAAIAFTDDAKLPEPGADGQPAQGAGGAAAPACASIPVAPSGPIVVNKKGPAKCPLKGPCAFTIDITNSSAAPVPGPIEIVDTIDLPNATIAGGVAAPFACDPGGSPFKCRFNGTLQPKETKTLSLTLNIDAPAGTKSLKNCAVPTQPQAAAPGQGQEQKQLAPGKKSNLFPFGRKPLFDFAAFRPQSFGASTALFHLAGGAGGNIGGVGPNNCLKWGMDRGGFNVTQSNGPQVGFGNLKVGPDGRTTGDASFIADDGPVTGKVEGTIIGSHVDLTVTWNRGVKKGHYVGEISPSGDFSGTNTASNGVKASFKTNRIWFQCAVDQLCQNYANEAVAAATEFGSLHCGAGGPGRWSTDPNEHITWCMAQTRGGDSPIPTETEARKTQLDSCREFDARCTKAGLAIAASNDEMKALNCKDAIPSLQPDKAKAACKAAAIKFSPESLAESAQQKLAACKLAKLNGDGGAGGAADPGGAGGAGDPGGAADPGNGGAGNAQQQPANQCVTVELEDNVPEQKPAGTLAISKNPAAGKCTAMGGGCDFVVTVFNPDPAVEFNGTVSFTDHISQPDGTAFPNVTVQTPINPQADPGISGGNLVCKKDGNDVNCTSLGASLKIPPGKKIVVPLNFTPGGDTVAKAVKNCASLPGGDPQCVTIPFAENGPLLRAKKMAVGNPTTCVPNCEFVIQLSNVGTSDAQGPFVLKDVFKAANGMDSFKMIGDSKFACSSTNGTIGCISTNGNTNKLAPGETISGFIVFDVKSVSPEYSNCLVYDPAAQAKPSPFDAEAGPLCATIKDTAHGGPNLLVQLTAPNEGADGVGECAINSPCRFSVLVRSNGAVDFPERARFVATVSPNLPQTLRSPPGDGRWICSPNANGKIECSDGAQSKLLAVGNQLPGEIEVVAGPGWQKNAILTLCTEIRPANSASDTNPADNLACKSVKLDPFNVKVQKTGDQSCAPGGDCHFTINLFNPGPIDHNAPVTITDQLKGLSSARIVSITPPLPCASQPTQIPFSCTSPGAVCLDFGAKAGDKCGPRTFEMVVRLPNDQSATQFSNCASATDGQKNRSDEESCATVSLKPVATTEPPPPEALPVVVTPPGECFGGMVMMGGLCQCPPGTRFNGRRCLSDDGDGGAYPVHSDTVTMPPPPPRCPSFRPIGTYPNCCPIGTVFRFGACRKPQRIEEPPPLRPACPSYRPVGTYPDCCPVGMEFRFGACRKRPSHDEPPPPPKCPSYRPIGTPPNCCPIGMEFRFGACRRPIGSGGSDGNIPNGSKPPPPKCPSYRPIGTYPNCCPVGMEFRFGTCRRPQHKDDTGTGNGGTNSTQSQDGDRKCPSGYHKLRRPNKYGAYCEPDQQQGPPKCPANRPNGMPPNCCPSGTTFRLGQCYPEKCSPGWIGVPPHCRKPQTNPTPTGPTPTPVPQKPKCSGDKVPSTSGQCVCPNGTTDVGHNQCGDRVR